MPDRHSTLRSPRIKDSSGVPAPKGAVFAINLAYAPGFGSVLALQEGRNYAIVLGEVS